MKYLCLVYITENEIYSKPKGEFDSMVSEAMAYVEEIRRNGHCLAVERLHSVRAAASVRVRNGRVAVTDGPFAETKEQLAGFILIEARDLNEAIQIASRFPGAHYGTVEVRPVRELNEEPCRDKLQTQVTRVP